MRLKASQVRAYREQQWKSQNGICPLCQQYIPPDLAVLDHDHQLGYIRKVLHRGCNALEGKIKNASIRCGVTRDQLVHLLQNLLEYQQQHTDTLHPTYRTAEEKQERANARAKKRRAAAKANK